jgi:NAD(P)-dependent dehydrogenase (short-subunit alcohol dehydrogenase family)
MVQQVALIVGASRGIGRQVAIDLAKNDYAGKAAMSVKDILMDFL